MECHATANHMPSHMECQLTEQMWNKSNELLLQESKYRQGHTGRVEELHRNNKPLNRMKQLKGLNI